MNRFGPIALLVCLVAMPPASWAAAPPKSLEQTLEAAGRFNTYLALQKLAGPGKSGQKQTPQTYLVPNDAAFAALPAGELEKLKKNPANIRKFLDAYTLSGRVTVEDMVGPGRSQSHRIKSVQGITLEFEPAKDENVATSAPAPAPAPASASATAPSGEIPIVVQTPNLYIAPPPQIVAAPPVPNIPAPTQIIVEGMISIDPIFIQVPTADTQVEQTPLVVSGLTDNSAFQPVQIISTQPNLSNGGAVYELASIYSVLVDLGKP